jgi:hypothetical protein
MKINPIVHTRKDTGNFFQLRNEKKNVLPISEFWFQFTGFDMLLLFTTFSISLLEGWSYLYSPVSVLMCSESSSKVSEVHDAARKGTIVELD